MSKAVGELSGIRRSLERLLIERPSFVARVGCFPNAKFFHVDVGRSRGIWFDAAVGLD